MNSRVRQVLPRATGGFGPSASPARTAGRYPVPVKAGNAVRHATAKAPDGAGAIGAAGHVVAPALPADGPGSPCKPSLLQPLASSLASSLTGRSERAWHPDHRDDRARRGPRNVTCDCYAAAQDDSPAPAYIARRRRYFLPAPDQGTRLLDRIRGDRLRRTAACRAVEARSGFGRGVSLSFEPAPQTFRNVAALDRTSFRRRFPPRIRRRIVARARS